jgi:Pyruvate/2-oxoacid:ferredoxin oxidoreductase gamma subunit
VRFAALITNVALVVLLAGCTGLPFQGEYLERALREEPKTQIRAAAENEACRCEAVCVGGH